MVRSDQCTDATADFVTGDERFEYLSTCCINFLTQRENSSKHGCRSVTGDRKAYVVVVNRVGRRAVQKGSVETRQPRRAAYYGNARISTLCLQHRRKRSRQFLRLSYEGYAEPVKHALLRNRNH